MEPGCKAIGNSWRGKRVRNYAFGAVRRATGPRATLAATALAVMSACSLSLKRPGGHLESIVGHAALCRDGKTFYRAAFGLDIRIGSEWDGVDVGWSALASLQPSGEDPRPTPDHGFLRFAPPLGLTFRRGNGNQRWFGWFVLRRDAAQDPVGFLHRSRAGAGVQLSHFEKAAQVGFSRTTVLHAPTTHDGTYLLKYSSRRPCDGELIKLKEDTK